MEKVNKVPKGEINGVKEVLANKALEQLEEGVGVGGFENTKVEFGYVYSIGDRYEALFKMTTDKKTIYFAVQQGKLMRLQDSFSEEQFQGMARQVEATHGEWG